MLTLVILHARTHSRTHTHCRFMAICPGLLGGGTVADTIDLMTTQ